jgi:hypothetical protein
MTCQKCGKLLDADATFCGFCGHSITATAFAQTTAPVAPPPTYQMPPAAPAYAPAAMPVAVSPAAAPIAEPLTYTRFVETLAAGQHFLTQLAIRFWYATGLKSYLVTSHESMILPNLRKTPPEIYAAFKQVMDSLNHTELKTTFLYMKTEHIQTLPYLSRSALVDVAGVNHDLHFFGALAGAVRLLAEVFFGIFFLLVDGVKWIMHSVSQSAGMELRAVGREGEDELRTGKRLLLASTYRHTRCYAYVRDVGPETYVGWFVHHEPLPGVAALLLLSVLSLIYSFVFGSLLGIPFLYFFGAVGAILYVFLFAPWLLGKMNALPQPRYISALVFATYLPLFLAGAGLAIGLLNGLSNPASILLGGEGQGPRLGFGESDPFIFLFYSFANTTGSLLTYLAIITILRSVSLKMTHYDHFDAETHAKIIRERLGILLSGYLHEAGYTESEIANILKTTTPTFGRA